MCLGLWVVKIVAHSRLKGLEKKPHPRIETGALRMAFIEATLGAGIFSPHDCIRRTQSTCVRSFEATACDQASYQCFSMPRGRLKYVVRKCHTLTNRRVSPLMKGSRSKDGIPSAHDQILGENTRIHYPPIINDIEFPV